MNFEVTLRLCLFQVLFDLTFQILISYQIACTSYWGGVVVFLAGGQYTLSMCADALI